ncbi:cytoplasmic protein, partial [Candidatus Thiomargarita nelsonii]
MKPTIHKYLESLTLGYVQKFKNMATVPLLAPGDNGPEYLTLQDALDQQVLKITEIDQSGSVPELKVTNTATQYVLLLDGEELMGAKQNRVLNTSILLKPQTETIIPVSCTEQGRWAYSSAEFSSSGHVMARSIRSSKTQSVHESLRRERSYSSDQGTVWNEINELSAATRVDSPTGAMRDVYESKASELAEYEKAFEPQAKQHGLLVMINAQVVGFDILSRSSAYQQLHPKL